MATIDDLKAERLKKLEKLKKLGVDPYPSRVNRSQTIADARQMDGKNVSVAGRLTAIRGHGKILFGDLVDESGKIQLLFKSDILHVEKFATVELLDRGDFLSVAGTVGKTQAGEITITVENYDPLTKTIHPLPDKWHGLKDIEERYRKRYLDMFLNPVVRETLRVRGDVIQTIRNFLMEKGFIEVETPTLQPVYGGGFAHPFVTHHNALDADFYLRISDEMYLKRLIVGGFEKVYEITKVFRNEGIDHDHNPEFTMFEAQIAYEDYSYGMDIIEEIIEHVAIKVLGKTTFQYQGIETDVKRPWKRYKMVEAIQKYTGVDSLSWRTVEEAKKAVGKLEIPPEKLKVLDKIQTIGEVIAFVFEHTVEEKLVQPTIIYDFPIEVSPLAKKCDDPRFTQRFEMFVFGSELGNNYTELNDPIDLRQRFVEEKKREAAGFEEAHQTDFDYLEAIEYGFPPTCGIAIGIDRFVMLLTDAKNIKEVIAFPTLKPLHISKKEKVILPGEGKVTAKPIVPRKSEKKENLNITRQEALLLVKDWVKNPNLVKHMLAVEAEMRALAKHFNEDEDLWGLVGLLHDADWEKTQNTPDTHTLVLAQELEKRKVSQELITIILSHNFEMTGKGREPQTRADWAIYTCDELSGLITATALIRPDKKLASVEVESIKKKWGNTSFAAGVDRKRIEKCEEVLGIPLDEFIKMCLAPLQNISGELGL